MEEETIFVIKNGCEYALTENRIRELTSKYIELINEDASLHNDFGKNCKVVDLLINIKRAYWPATIKNLNVDVQDFDKQLDKWYELQKEMLEEKKKEEIEI